MTSPVSFLERDKILRTSLADITLQSKEPSETSACAAGIDHSVRILKTTEQSLADGCVPSVERRKFKRARVH